ncbi:MAG: ABC transporter ATP-binding protein [Candidatus Aminicenantes bacterium]
MSPAIQIKNLTRIYQKYSAQHRFKTFKSALLKGDLFRSLRPDEMVKALDNVTLDVGKGTTFGVIGENGSGKSTLLKVITGINKPTSGEVKVEGKVSALIELGAGFHPEITGRENIYINGIMLGLSRKEIDRKFEDIVKFAELEDFIDAPVKTYSSGMYMRLGFSIAINVNPDVLLVDEVLAVGDASFVPKCLDRIDDFRRRKKTILFVSHDLSTVEKICDQVAWLKNGQVQTIGEARRVIDAYLQDVADKKEGDFKKRQEEVTDQPDYEEERRENRWGKREIEIKKVRILGNDGRPQHVFHPDENMIIEMDVEAYSRRKDFVFGIGIFNSQGICCYGTNTLLEDYKPRSMEGRQKVICRLKKLHLVNGTYYLDIAVHKRDGYPYDYHRSLYSFLISSRFKDSGIFRPDHSWEFTPGIDMGPPVEKEESRKEEA